jgi:hypothetical protein
MKNINVIDEKVDSRSLGGHMQFTKATCQWHDFFHIVVVVSLYKKKLARLEFLVRRSNPIENLLTTNTPVTSIRLGKISLICNIVLYLQQTGLV